MKTADKVTHVGKAGLQGYFGHREISGLQQVTGVGQAQMHQVLGQCQMEMLLKIAGQIFFG